MTRLTGAPLPTTSLRSSTPADPSGGLDTGVLRLATPIGRVELRSRDGNVTAVHLEQAGRLPFDGVDERPAHVLLDAAEQLLEYFRGERREFTVPLVAQGTGFQEAVWAALRAVPFGASIDYGALASAAGAPRGGRAAGQAVRANPLPLLVPCHRALGSTGGITGYSGGEGPSTKRWLLEHEGIPYRR